MSYQYQDPVAIADTDKLTISTWFSFPTFPPDTDPMYSSSKILEWFLPLHSVVNSVHAGKMDDPANSFLQLVLCGTDSAPPNAVFVGVPFVFTRAAWYNLFFSFSGNDFLVNLLINSVDVLTPNLPDALIGLDDPAADYTIRINGGKFGDPVVVSTDFAHPLVRRAFTQIWFGTYVDPSPANLSKFFTVKGSKISPPTDPLAAQKAFGTSQYHCYRDKNKKIQYQKNKGSAGPLTVVGTVPADFKPGPGQT